MRAVIAAGAILVLILALMLIVAASSAATRRRLAASATPWDCVHKHIKGTTYITVERTDELGAHHELPIGSVARPDGTFKMDESFDAVWEQAYLTMTRLNAQLTPKE